MAAIRFLSTADVLESHRETVALEGGTPGVRDLGLLESAVAMPQQRFGGVCLHPDLAATIAAYLYHLSGNHPFLDGNKRVAVIAAIVFLEVNGVPFVVEPDDLERIVMRVASSQMSKADLIRWFRKATPRPRR